MLALIFDKTLKLEDVPLPERKEDESLIRVNVAGICNTDIEIVKGYMGFKGILGHEFAGVVEESNDKSLIGKRVVGEINIACGRCDFCKKGLKRHCINRSVLGIANKDGVFAEYITLKNENLLIVPDSVTDYEAVFTEPVAAALEIREQLHIPPDEEIAVIGDGKLGMLIAQILRLNGNEISILGKNRSKLDILKSIGFEAFPGENYSGKKFNFIVECSGNTEGFKKALELINPRGVIVLKSTYHENLTFDVSQVVVNEINLVGSRCGRFAPALNILEKKLIKTDFLISKVFKLEDAVTAFEYSQKSDTLKVLIEI